MEAELRIPLDRAPVAVLFGPSGSGKTTLLRMLAGLERPDAGSIVFREIPWFDSARGIHLAAARASRRIPVSGLRACSRISRWWRMSPTRRLARLPTSCSTRFGLADLAASKPRALSGGEQQRVALARALAAEPALLLLDEPLSALDAPTRARMRYELRRMLLASGVPSIVVTHDRMEAVALGDWMAVIVDGRIRQTGPVQEVFRRPADLQVAESVGVENVLAAEIVGRDAGLLVLQVGDGADSMRGFRGDRAGLRLHSRRGCCDHAPDGSGVERAQPPGGTRARGDSGRCAGARRTRLRISAGGAGHGAIRRRIGAARRRNCVRGSEGDSSGAILAAHGSLQ